MCNRILLITARIFISILSFVLAFAGFGLLLIGIVAKTQADSLQQIWQPLISTVTTQAKLVSNDGVDIPSDYLDVEQLVGGLSTAFIVTGVILFIIGLIGVAGACCMVKIMSICYLAVVAVMTLSMLILVIILAANRSIVTDPPKSELTATLQSEYRGLNGSDVTSLFWNAIMSWQQCCGVNNYRDFDQAAQWQKLFGNTTSFKYKTPAACCKTGMFDSTSQSCAVSPTTSNNNMETGCYDKIVDPFLTGPPFVGFACGTVLGFSLLTFFSAVILYNIIRTEKAKQAA